MSKTIFNIVIVILIPNLLSACNNPNTPDEQDPLKGHEQKFLDTNATSEAEEVVFYDLVEPKKNNQTLDTEETSTSEPKDQDKQGINSLPPEVIESIRANAELKERKKNALNTIAEAKRIEALLVGEDHSSDDGYTYNGNE